MAMSHTDQPEIFRTGAENDAFAYQSPMGGQHIDQMHKALMERASSIKDAPLAMRWTPDQIGSVAITWVEALVMLRRRHEANPEGVQEQMGLTREDLRYLYYPVQLLLVDVVGQFQTAANGNARSEFINAATGHFTGQQERSPEGRITRVMKGMFRRDRNSHNGTGMAN